MDSFANMMLSPAAVIVTTNEDHDLPSLLINLEKSEEVATGLVNEEKYGGGVAVAFCVIA
jgi:hypothetical protein